MVERQVNVASKVGLHARPAALFVKAASQQGLPVFIAKAGASPVPATSLLSVLGLCVGHGENVVISAEGDGAETALDALADILTTDFD